MASRLQRASILLGAHGRRAELPPAPGLADRRLSADTELAQALQAVRAAHFSADGRACDYAGLAGSQARERLAACLASLADFDPRALRIPFQTAFWLNFYNACVLRDALELIAPGNVHRAQGFFQRRRAQLAGHDWSLDDIEHGLLREAPKYGRIRAPMKKSDPRLIFVPLVYDERMHFGMYSACRSSPPLRVFHGEHLDEELESATRDYIARTVRVQAAGAVVQVPKLFQWYAGDFGGEAGVLDFVLARIDDEAAIDLVDRRRGRVRLQYAEYDWTLNSQPENA